MRKAHSISPHAKSAVEVLGLEIARARRTRRLSQVQLAERAGISEPTLSSIERGVPTVGIGIVFEVASLVGLDLFGAETDDLPALVARGRDRLALLPRRVRAHDQQVSDAF